MILSSCQSRIELQEQLRQHTNLSASRIDKLLSLVILHHKNSAGVPLWCRGTSELAPCVREAVPIMHINMHILNNVINLYLRALHCNYFNLLFSNAAQVQEFVAHVKMLIKSELNATKSSPRAQFIPEYQLRQVCTPFP